MWCIVTRCLVKRRFWKTRVKIKVSDDGKIVTQIMVNTYEVNVYIHWGI